MADTAESTTTDLVDWIRSILPDVPTVARPLGARERASGVDVRLMRAAPRAAARTAEPPSILDLDYLVTVQMPDAAAEQNALVELLFAAAARHDSEVVTDQSVAELCATLGIPVATGFVLRTPLVRIPARRPARRVRVPLVVHSADMGVIEGRVLGPNDVPIAGAVIVAAGLGNTARSGHDGRFRLVGMPATRAGVPLTARARGAEAEGVGVVGQPVIFRLALED
ncbi:MAG TPA: carboxypeptidase-like regulatory domain-containing protein [Rhizomicrobium sp.]|nr:carboxypeptidase-like regulatory domain-containing protein [Rhizomicrobium sp.]